MATIKQKQEDGTEIDVEVFTQAELDAKIASEKSALQTEYEVKLQEKDTSLNALATEKADLEAKLGGVDKENPNFKVLKDALDKKDGEIRAIRESIENDKKSVREESMNTKVKLVAGTNEELAKKIKFNLTNTLASMKEDTEEDRVAKFNAALKLSADSSIDTPSIMDLGIGGGGSNRGSDFSQKSTVEFTKREIALGEKLGITDEDRKKFGPKLTIKKQ